MAPSSSAASIAFWSRTVSSTAGQSERIASRSRATAGTTAPARRPSPRLGPPFDGSRPRVWRHGDRRPARGSAASRRGGGAGAGGSGPAAARPAFKPERARRRPLPAAPPGARSAPAAPGGRVDLGRGGLDQRELELRARVGAGLQRLERAGEQVEQAHDLGATRARRLLGQALVALGSHAQLRRHLAERLHDQQLARVRLEVAQELPGVATGPAQPRDRAERGGGVARGDRIHGLEQQLGVGHAQHGEHAVQLDRAARRR